MFSCHLPTSNANIKIIFSIFMLLLGHRRHLRPSKLEILTILPKFRIAWKLVYKFYTPSIPCVSFIEIRQVVLKNQVFKVVNIYIDPGKSMPSTGSYLHCETCVPDTHNEQQCVKRRCNTCKLAHTPLLSSLIIFYKSQCYLNG